MVQDLKAADHSYSERVQQSFNKQQALATIGGIIEDIAPGRVVISFKFSESLTQQHGFIHAGILSTVMDSACGYAAYSLMPVDAGVLTIEFKTNLLSPAVGERFIAIGEVKKPGRTITVANADMFAEQNGNRKLIASMTATLMTISGRQGVSG